MSRKVGKSSTMQGQGQRRRSPRISALDSSNQKQLSRINTTTFDEAAALPPLSKLPKQIWKGRDSPENADCVVEWRSLKENQKHGDDDEDEDVITNDKATALPAKHILELVLDTLQRRDTYEIFAQPVDPDVVEDYYEIIKESMDFGTMRAKLHEGMYQNLQQFEHDVFLIPENAMHFNSSATTYFRQARAIHDLANKVFHVLKTNPENFVSEFSGTRRRSMRKMSETKDSIAAKSIQCPSTSTIRRSNKKTLARTLLTAGSGDGMLSNSQAANRRDTYLCKKDDMFYPTFYNNCKPLILGDINYKDSIMRYAKGLGATAQMVAKRKLLGEHVSSSSEKCGKIGVKEFKTFRDFAPAAGSNPFLKASTNIIEHKKFGEEANLRHKIIKEKNAADIPTLTTSTPKVTVTSTKKVIRNPSAPVVKDLNSSSRPVILALENYHSNVAEFKSRNKKSCMLPPRPVSVCDESSQKQKQQQQQQQQQKPLPLIPSFTFDLPFLKARLEQMKAVESGRPPSFGKGGFSIT